MTEEKLSFREKREQLNQIFNHMGVPRHLFYVLTEAEKYLDKNCPTYQYAIKLIEELKINVKTANSQTVSSTKQTI